MKIVLHAKPLSTNRLFQGRRFRTKEYDAYEEEIGFLLPRQRPQEPPGTTLEVRYALYLKNHKRTDGDNCVKALTDILVKTGFIEDDRYIYRYVIEKHPSKTDRIEVEILPYAP